MFFRSFIQTLPVLMGYIPLGVTFGILYANLHLPWYYGILSAVVVFTGTGQFLLVSLLATHTGLFEIAIASFLLNVRHLFYALSITEDIKNFGLSKYYVLFGLTDETFAVLKGNQAALDSNDSKAMEKNYLFITLLNHLYWIIGCGIGIFLGEYFQLNPAGIEFVLTALFSALTLSLLQNSKLKEPFYIACVLGVFGLIVFPKENFLLLSILCGITILLFLKPWTIKRV
ncbi:AzlC family ABC transporter permease [Helicobacter turcicus]|uniref:AzlC family ABC transporter permease n=1 Tax=Helicobacter turcicus TaxID=2867412 RepID=A0ABS7JL69_9HELI|nr:AzlC family ABC transporter permease [Helicobacter turcicus]MBX7490120.1 AzlC family ABC transporter permease [Helicobacter turcicus]MBX7544979.1 AzlC family ABC transporter permease [Helicobacter turcicus]